MRSPLKFGFVAALVTILAGSTAVAQQTAPRSASPSTGRRETTERAPVRTAQREEPPQEQPRQQPGQVKPQRQQPQAQGAKGQAPAVRAPQAPFKLSPQETEALEQVLKKWEDNSKIVKTFKCSFVRLEYDVTFGIREKQYLRTEGTGDIKYRAPDHGTFRINKMTVWTAQKDAPPKEEKVTEALEHWVCDGESIFQYNRDKKQVVQTKLPPEMQGKAITNGPLPFMFGATAATLKARYFIREITPSDVKVRKEGKQIWLAIYPRYQRDAAEFRRVEFILNESDCQPVAMQIFLPAVVDPGKPESRTVYSFSNIKINDRLGFIKGDFLPPMTPFGWKLVVENVPAQPAAAPKGAQGQAQRPAKEPATDRK